MRNISICDHITNTTTKEEAMKAAILLYDNMQPGTHILFGMLGVFVEPVVLSDNELKAIIKTCGRQLIYCYHA